MITVRFNTGVAITYNEPNEFEYKANGSIRLIKRDADGKTWYYADIAPGTQCVLEVSRACKIENPAEGSTVEGAIKMLVQSERSLRSAPGYWLSRLKEQLKSFNRRTMQWKENV